MKDIDEVNSSPITPRPQSVAPSAPITPRTASRAPTPTIISAPITPRGMSKPQTPTLISAPITPRGMSKPQTPTIISAPITPRGLYIHPTRPMDVSAPITPRPFSLAGTPSIVSAPQSQFHSPSMSRSPLLDPTKTKTRTPMIKSRNLTPRFITPLGSPLRKVMKLTRLDPQDAWLPITESRNGNAYYAAFHTLCSGIGIQALILPVAFTILGWTWGLISLTLAFIWQLYTLYIMVELHESVETGLRYSRYMHLANATFGEKTANIIAAFPIINLSAGTCSALIIIGGSTAKILYQTLCGPTCSNMKPLTTVEWYLIFTCVAVLLSQLPNLNSIAGISLIGAITAVGYCTVLWIVSVSEGRLPNVSYNPIKSKSEIAKAFDVLNAIGIVAFAFRGHNLVLEIQATMPSDEKHPSRVPMWRGVKGAYAIVAACLFPLAIGGYWSYGQLIPAGGMLSALFVFHAQQVARGVIGLVCCFVIINALCSFQIYGMPMFDNMESSYTTRFKKACPWWVRGVLRAFFGFMSFFMAVALPFLSTLAGLIGGISLPITFAYPCFMWLKMKKPKTYSPIWWLNWILGIFGTALSGICVAAGIYVIVDSGIKFSFFNPQ